MDKYFYVYFGSIAIILILLYFVTNLILHVKNKENIFLSNSLFYWYVFLLFMFYFANLE